MQSSPDPIRSAPAIPRRVRRNTNEFVDRHLKDGIGQPWATIQKAIDTELASNPGFLRQVNARIGEIVCRKGRAKNYHQYLLTGPDNILSLLSA